MRVLTKKRQTGLGIIMLHLLVVLAIVSGTKAADWLVFAVVYPLAAIGVGVAMHRYFAHRAFQTSRWFQFVLALMASLSFGNPLYFAGKHQLHHRHSDTPQDVHTPFAGWWHCWFGSLMECGYRESEITRQVAHWHSYAELAWLYRHPAAPGLILCTVLYVCGGFSMMVVGGMLSSVLLLHQSSAVNYFCHCRGSRRFTTHDASTNHPLVAVLTFGEGWHNNHHRFPRSARAGLKWWEVDLFYGVICLLESLGIIWAVHRIPEHRLQRARVNQPIGETVNAN